MINLLWLHLLKYKFLLFYTKFLYNAHYILLINLLVNMIMIMVSDELILNDIFFFKVKHIVIQRLVIMQHWKSELGWHDIKEFWAIMWCIFIVPNEVNVFFIIHSWEHMIIRLLLLLLNLLHLSSKVLLSSLFFLFNTKLNFWLNWKFILKFKAASRGDKRVLLVIIWWSLQIRGYTIFLKHILRLFILIN
jgi:hypothetical protein